MALDFSKMKGKKSISQKIDSSSEEKFYNDEYSNSENFQEESFQEDSDYENEYYESDYQDEFPEDEYSISEYSRTEDFYENKNTENDSDDSSEGFFDTDSDSESNDNIPNESPDEELKIEDKGRFITHDSIMESLLSDEENSQNSESKEGLNKDDESHVKLIDDQNLAENDVSEKVEYTSESSGTLPSNHEKSIVRVQNKEKGRAKGREKKRKEALKKRKINPPADFEETTTRTIYVKDGIPEGFSKGSMAGNSGLRNTQKKQKLSSSNINTFENFYISDRRTSEEELITTLLSKPAGVKETTREKAQRERRVKMALENSSIFDENTKFNFTDRDKEILEFLAIFKYATSKQLSYLKGNAERTIDNRMSKLLKKGLVKKKNVVGSTVVWYLSKVGMALSGYELKVATDSSITPNQMAHQFTVNHVAANLWGANLNVLEEDNFPQANRKKKNGERDLGEMLSSETELLSEFAKKKNFQGASDYKSELMRERRNAFLKWKREGLEKGELPPPFELGNEWMWVILPEHRQGLSVYHVPDLVVKRPPKKNGYPRAVAVEIELHTKRERGYERILKSYKKEEMPIYGKVVWVCHKLSSARRIEKVGKQLGMIQDGTLSVVPIITEDGPFIRGDLWTL